LLSANCNITFVLLLLIDVNWETMYVLLGFYLILITTQLISVNLQIKITRIFHKYFIEKSFALIKIFICLYFQFITSVLISWNFEDCLESGSRAFSHNESLVILVKDAKLAAQRCAEQRTQLFSFLVQMLQNKCSRMRANRRERSTTSSKEMTMPAESAFIRDWKSIVGKAARL